MSGYELIPEIPVVRALHLSFRPLRRPCPKTRTASVRGTDGGRIIYLIPPRFVAGMSQTFQENVSPSFDRDESTMFRVPASNIRCRRTLFTHGYEEPHFAK
jgi:hypothetical protein